ncbi:hypothetical protein Tco_0261331 [Tanacetum coccineum]
MTYTTTTAQYDLPGIEDMVPNIWSLVKVNYDRYALWGISHWRQQHKSFYTYARGMQSRGDVYFTKRILAVTHVKVTRKHRYGYLEEIVVRRADNILYRFKEGDDVTDFAIALRMFTRSMVIQKRVEDLQLRVESYQKKINVTKPDTTRPDLRKRDPHYQEYQHGVLSEEKMKHIGEKKSSFHDQGHQQAAKGKEDDEEFGEIRWITKMIADIEDWHHRPSDAMHNPPWPLKVDPRGFKGIYKDGHGDFRYSDTERLSRSDEVLKLKNFKKDTTLKLFKSTNQERYEHVSPEVTSSQDGKGYKMAKRDYAWLMISRCSRSHSRQAKEQAQDLKSMTTITNHKLMIEVKRAQD